MREGTAVDVAAGGSRVDVAAGGPRLGVAASGPRFVGARCHGADPDLFFGPSGIEPRVDRQRREAEAKALCRGCPALIACREHALANAEVFGVWGGLGEQERRMQLVRLGRLAHSA